MIALGYWLRVLLVAAVLACTTPPAWSGDVKVAFINPDGPPEFWQLLGTTMKAAAAELRIDVETRDSDHSRDKAITIAQDFLAERPPPDYLIAANDVDAGGEVVNLADAAHVKTVDRVLNREMVVSRGGHFLLGAWAMVVIRDYKDGRDFAEEDMRLQFPMSASDPPVARRIPEFGKATGAGSTSPDAAKPAIQLSRATTFLRTPYWAGSRPTVKRGAR